MGFLVPVVPMAHHMTDESVSFSVLFLMALYSRTPNAKSQMAHAHSHLLGGFDISFDGPSNPANKANNGRLH